MRESYPIIYFVKNNVAGTVQIKKQKVLLNKIFSCYILGKTLNIMKTNCHMFWLECFPDALPKEFSWSISSCLLALTSQRLGSKGKRVSSLQHTVSQKWKSTIVKYCVHRKQTVRHSKIKHIVYSGASDILTHRIFRRFSLHTILFENRFFIQLYIFCLI